MNNIQMLFKQTKNKEEFSRAYLSYLSELFAKMDFKEIAKFISELEQSRDDGSTVFTIGNGGSSSTASHMANDFGLDVLKKSGSAPFRVMSLCDNVAVMTAIGNDDGYQNLFLYQLKIHYRPGDKLVVISASGNSPNLVEAAQWVKKQGGKIIGLLGFDGGKLKELCDVQIVVETPKGEYGPVEDVHMVMNHLVGNYLLFSSLEKTGKELPAR